MAAYLLNLESLVLAIQLQVHKRRWNIFNALPPESLISWI